MSFHHAKIIIRITEGVKKRASCRELFEKFNTLPLPTEYLFSSLSFYIDKAKILKHIYKDTLKKIRQIHNLLVQHAKLTIYQKDVHCAGTNNALPTSPSNLEA